MPRKAAHSQDHLIASALDQFWAHGFSATSMDDLVRATGVSRHGIYKAFAGKDALFAAVFERYDREVVSPAFAVVEAPGATLEAVAAYLDHQISLAQATGLPGPGCLVGNTQSEPAAQTEAVQQAITAHRARLQAGFEKAIRNEAPGLSTEEAEALALVLLTSAQGLWSASRVIGDADALRTIAATILDLLRKRLAHG
ncbi:MAG: TetR/AcrR family transcriptional regulator [Pseudomonadota bacterium]